MRCKRILLLKYVFWYQAPICSFSGRKQLIMDPGCMLTILIEGLTFHYDYLVENSSFTFFLLFIISNKTYYMRRLCFCPLGICSWTLSFMLSNHLSNQTMLISEPYRFDVTARLYAALGTISWFWFFSHGTFPTPLLPDWSTWRCFLTFSCLRFYFDVGL